MESSDPELAGRAVLKKTMKLKSSSMELSAVRLQDQDWKPGFESRDSFCFS